MLAVDLIDRIAGLPNPVDRLATLQTAAAIALDTAWRTGGVSDFPTRGAIRVALESFVAAEHEAPTAEATFNIRSGQEALLAALGALVFASFGLVIAVEHGRLFLRHVPRDQITAGTELLGDYHRLLVATMNWQLKRYEQLPFCQALAAAEARHRNEFDRLRAELTVSLSSPLVRVEGNSIQSLVDAMRMVRAIVQVSGNQGSEPSNVEEVEGQSGEIFLIPLWTSDHGEFVVGFVACENAYHLWWTDAWIGIQSDFLTLSRKEFGKGHEHDRFFESHSTHSHIRIATLLEGKDESHKQNRLRFIDLTVAGMPYPWLADPEGRYAWSSGRAISSARTIAPSQPRMAFWGNIQFAGPNPLEIDDVTRRIRIRSECEATLTYPACDNFEVSMAFTERPLPFSAYERWFLEDECRSGRIDLEVFSGGAASRRAFLETNWEAYSILHLSTHGKGISSTPECAWLRLAGKDRVFFADILALDWSSLDLVFLNACMTDAGARPWGEGSVSLGWAFLAGGARAVIGTRWPVPDDVAFLFAKCLYGRLLGNSQISVEEAFGGAMQELRQTYHPKPHAWGAYVLLT